MKKEFKPGDPVMVKGKIIELDDVYNNYFTYKVQIGNQTFWLQKDTKFYPIPTPPQPLRVDELEPANEYEWDDCGRRQKGIFRTNVGKYAIMEIPIGDDDYYVTPVLESLNIRPVEREVTGQEIVDYFRKQDKVINSVNVQALVNTVRHFMKGGGK